MLIQGRLQITAILARYLRFETMSNLFYDENLDERVTIKADDWVLEMLFENGIFKCSCHEKGDMFFLLNYGYDGRGSGSISTKLSPFKFYKFSVKESYPLKEIDFLRPPHGENLFQLIMTHKTLRKVPSQYFEPFGLSVLFRRPDNKIEIMKQEEDIAITYPYSLASDTLQRIIFYVIAIDSNKDSVLIFEEPESHAFPYYTNFLGEKIARDESNQYFIATHNPYLLFSILEKAPKSSVNIVITYLRDFQTRVKCLMDNQIPEFMNYDPFLNLCDFIEEEGQ